MNVCTVNNVHFIFFKVLNASETLFFLFLKCSGAYTLRPILPPPPIHQEELHRENCTGPASGAHTRVFTHFMKLSTKQSRRINFIQVSNNLKRSLITNIFFPSANIYFRKDQLLSFFKSLAALKQTFCFFSPPGVT
jgi:hypothetical protein